MGLVAEAEQDRGRHAALGELPAQDRHRRDADAAADQDRPGGAVGAQLGGARERRCRAGRDPELSPSLERREPLGAGADGLDQEVEPDAAIARLGRPATENARGRNGRRPRAPQPSAAASM